MAEALTSPLAGLAPIDPPEGAGVTLAERPFLAKVTLRADAASASFQEAVRTVLGCYLPPVPPQVARRQDYVAFRIGPDEWLVSGPRETQPVLMAGLAAELANLHAALVDVSSAYTVVRVTGPAASTVMAKGCSLDLGRLGHDVAFATKLGPFAILLHVLRPGEGYDVYVGRSYARSLWHWLSDAGAEHGAESRP
jgi:sarcosine oxidase, subunit gamma